MVLDEVRIYNSYQTCTKLYAVHSKCRYVSKNKNINFMVVLEVNSGDYSQWGLSSGDIAHSFMIIHPIQTAISKAHCYHVTFIESV